MKITINSVRTMYQVKAFQSIYFIGIRLSLAQ
jgi:hypothetical protein